MDNEVSEIFGRHTDAPRFHHCMPVAGVEHGTIRPDRSLSSPDFLPAYEWLEQEIGFFPLFIAVGASDEVIRMSGYTDNWRVFAGCEGGIKQYRRKGEFPNLALFSFRSVDGVFMDYVDWHIALNACMKGHHVSPFGKRRIFKPYWKKHRWIQAALQGTNLVQIVIPKAPPDRSGGSESAKQVGRKVSGKTGIFTCVNSTVTGLGYWARSIPVQTHKYHCRCLWSSFHREIPIA